MISWQKIAVLIFFFFIKTATTKCCQEIITNFTTLLKAEEQNDTTWYTINSIMVMLSEFYSHNFCVITPKCGLYGYQFFFLS